MAWITSELEGSLIWLLRIGDDIVPVKAGGLHYTRKICLELAGLPQLWLEERLLLLISLLSWEKKPFSGTTVSPLEFWIQSSGASLGTAQDATLGSFLQTGSKGLGDMNQPPSSRESFVCDHSLLLFKGKALQAINNPCETAIEMFAGNK